MKIIEFPKDASAEQLAENFLEYTREGNVKWVVMVIMESDDTLRYEWSMLPNNLAAIGAVEFLKHRLMEE
jgi:hypothetical protein